MHRGSGQNQIEELVDKTLGDELFFKSAEYRSCRDA